MYGNSICWGVGEEMSTLMFKNYFQKCIMFLITLQKKMCLIELTKSFMTITFKPIAVMEDTQRQWIVS